MFATELKLSKKLLPIETTALTVAYHRALESVRPDRLFEDPFAALFVAIAGDAALSAAKLLFASTDYFAIRTRFFDDFLSKSCRSGCRQVVLLASGLDARAFRLPFPAGVRLFEVELQTMLLFKESVLSIARARPRCDRHLVSADLRNDWQSSLVQAGFRDVPTVWLIEGLLYFLTNEDTDRLLRDITELSPSGSAIGFDHVNEATLQAIAPIADGMARRGVGWRSAVEHPAPWLRDLGWTASVHPHGQVAERYGRPFEQLDCPAGIEPVTWLVEARRSGQT
ncbi:SAM-dependent methyltransferase [Pendulispora albinea]|uniref:S-adenosyl-L-methionine-dependent methyltransferase n=1 Tax=Pendulispora albinea TaxID=2741071 RepID=A0ABZ2LSK8_9BACT